MRKILVVNVNWLGDAIFSTPVFASLKAAFPQAHIACMCVPRVAEVLLYCPDVDEILVYDERGRDRWPWSKVRLIFALRRKKFDAAFLLHRSLTRNLLVYLAGIPQRIGYGKAKRLLTYPVVADANQGHRRDYYLKVVQAYGIHIADRQCRLRVSASAIASADNKLRSEGLQANEAFLVLNIGGNWDLKRWPVDHWVALAKHIHAHCHLMQIFSGSGKDRSTVEQILQEAKVPAINLAGQTSLGESLRVFQRAKVVVSADSGPLHLAASVGAPVVGIFGPTRPEITGPQGSGEARILFQEVGCNKAPCYHLGCLSNVCMQSIGVEDVWQAVQKFTG